MTPNKSCKRCGKEKLLSDFKREHNHSCLCSECFAGRSERHRQKAKSYYLAHREECIARAMAYSAAHPKDQKEYFREYSKRWRKINPVRVAEYNVRYWIQNRERINAMRRQNRQKSRNDPDSKGD